MKVTTSNHGWPNSSGWRRSPMCPFSPTTNPNSSTTSGITATVLSTQPTPTTPSPLTASLRTRSVTKCIGTPPIIILNRIFFSLITPKTTQVRNSPMKMGPFPTRMSPFPTRMGSTRIRMESTRMRMGSTRMTISEKHRVWETTFRSKNRSRG